VTAVTQDESVAAAEDRLLALQDILLLALDDAIVFRRDTFTFCGDCRRAADSLCADHADDAARADDYDAARRTVLRGEL
jgi:hypothetical protein